MSNLWKRIDGAKTYIGLIAAGILGIAVTMGWATWDQVDWLAVLITTWTGVAIRHAASKRTTK